MDLGLNEQTIRNLKLGQIYSGASARFERGSAIYTGPGFRTATDLGTSAAVGALREALVFNILFSKSGTNIYYMTDPDTGSKYDTGALVTSTEMGWFHEQGNGDVFYINQVDAPLRIAIAQNTTAVAISDTAITVGADWISKFSTPTTATFTADNTTDTFTSAAHGLSNGTIVMVKNAGGALPAGLSANTQYYVISAATNTFQLSLTSGGAAVDITTNGTGTQTFSTGFVYINGTGYLYTAKSGTQLTGCTEFAAGIPANTIITQTSNPSTFPAAYNGTFMFDLESRLFTGGRLHYENILSYSAPEDAANSQYFYDFQGNGAYQRIFTGKLTGGIKGIGRAYLFTNNQTFQATGIDVATGALIVQPISQNYGAYNPRCIVDMEGTVAFLGKKRLIPINLQLAVAGGSAPSLGLDFDLAIRPWLSALDDDGDQTDAKLHYDKTNQILKITARRNGVLETRVFDRANGAFLPSEIRSVKSYSMFNGKSYFGHFSNGKIYRDDYGLTNDGLPIYHAWSTGEIENDKGRQYMQGHSIEYSGFMSKGSEHTFNIYVDGSTTASYSQVFNDSLITDLEGVSLGSFPIPYNAIAGSQDVPKVFQFKNNVLLIGISGESFRLEWTVIKEGVYFKVSDFVLTAFDTNQNIRIRN